MGLKNIIKKLVMAFIAKNVEINNKRVENPLDTPPNSLDLNKSEVETLLLMIKEAQFKGEHVQKVYELVLKLQNYYSQLP
jgi:hypothetical protein